eukprot:Rmarinus@m.3187
MCFFHARKMSDSAYVSFIPECPQMVQIRFRGSRCAARQLRRRFVSQASAFSCEGVFVPPRRDSPVRLGLAGAGGADSGFFDHFSRRRKRRTKKCHAGVDCSENEKPIPGVLARAVEVGSVSPTLLRRYRQLCQNPVYDLLMRFVPGILSRMLADEKFLYKVLVEECLGVSGKLSAEYRRRGPKEFWTSLPFVATNVLTGMLSDFFLVFVPAPAVDFTAPTCSASVMHTAGPQVRTPPV